MPDGQKDFTYDHNIFYFEVTYSFPHVNVTLRQFFMMTGGQRLVDKNVFKQGYTSTLVVSKDFAIVPIDFLIVERPTHLLLLRPKESKFFSTLLS